MILSPKNNFIISITTNVIFGLILCFILFFQVNSAVSGYIAPCVHHKLPYFIYFEMGEVVLFVVTISILMYHQHLSSFKNYNYNEHKKVLKSTIIILLLNSLLLLYWLAKYPILLKTSTWIDNSIDYLSILNPLIYFSGFQTVLLFFLIHNKNTSFFSNWQKHLLTIFILSVIMIEIYIIFNTQYEPCLTK